MDVMEREETKIRGLWYPKQGVTMPFKIQLSIMRGIKRWILPTEAALIDGVEAKILLVAVNQALPQACVLLEIQGFNRHW